MGGLDNALNHKPAKQAVFREDIMRLIKLALAAALSLGFAISAQAQQAPVKIRLSWIVPVSNWASMIAEKKDLAKHNGKSYTLEITRFGGTPPLITALANNEVDIAGLTYPTLPIAIANAGLSDLMVIADEFQDGVSGYYANEFMVLKDGPIKKVEDLKGKVLATNAAGSAVDVAMRAMMKKHGLEDKRDYTVIEAPFATQRAMLQEKKIDLATAVLPYSLSPELRQIANTLFTTKDAMGPIQFSFWVARKSFLDKNRAAMMDFMEDSLRIVKWYLDPANQKEVMEIAGRVTKQPPERFDWVFTKKDNYREPNMLPDLKTLQTNVDSVRELGFYKDKIDVAKHADLSFVQEAAKRLK